MPSNLFFKRTGILIFVLMLFLQGCGNTQAKKEPEQKAKQSAAKDSTNPWSPLIEEAKEEKELIIISYLGGDALQAIQNEWKKANFGVDLKISTMQGEEFTQKITTERNANLYTLDVAIFGLGTLYNTMKKKGYIDPMDEKVLTIPEVNNPSLWWGKNLPYFDNEKMIIATTLTPQAPLLINTSVLSKNDITSYRDLLDPKYNKKILLNDPRKTGSSLRWFAAMFEKKVFDKQSFAALLEQAGAVTVDQLQQAQWVAQGKYPIGVGLDSSRVRQVQEAGASVSELVPKEGTLLTTGAGNLAFLKNAPHPKAAKLFINWFLTKDMQAVMSKALNAHTRRLDVDVKSLLSPQSIRTEGLDYYNTSTQEFTENLTSYQKLASELIGK